MKRKNILAALLVIFILIFPGCTTSSHFLSEAEVAAVADSATTAGVEKMMDAFEVSDAFHAVVSAQEGVDSVKAQMEAQAPIIEEARGWMGRADSRIDDTKSRVSNTETRLNKMDQDISGLKTLQEKIADLLSSMLDWQVYSMIGIIGSLLGIVCGLGALVFHMVSDKRNRDVTSVNEQDTEATST